MPNANPSSCGQIYPKNSSKLQIVDVLDAFAPIYEDPGEVFRVLAFGLFAEQVLVHYLQQEQSCTHDPQAQQ
jgi:hypothetical protein